MTTQTVSNIDIDAALREAEEQYTARNPKSLTQHIEACAVMPGGNTRTVLHYGPFPLTMARGAGSRLWDLDGHEYIDFLNEFTAGIYGHSNPVIRAAIDAALDRGINLGAQNLAEAKLAAAMRRLSDGEAVAQAAHAPSGGESDVAAALQRLELRVRELRAQLALARPTARDDLAVDANDGADRILARLAGGLGLGERRAHHRLDIDLVHGGSLRP
jgi:hypothetical protein